MADFAADAAALAAALGWERCHVVGTSFGGMVAQHLALRHPQLIDRLVLNCTSPGGALASFPLHELEGLAPDEAIERRLALFDTRYDPAADDPIPGFGPFLEHYRRAATAPLPDDRRLGLHRQLMARARHDVTAELGRIAAPTLVCAGRYDAIAPLPNSEALADGIPGARLEVFDGGHGFMLQDRRAHAVAMDFLDERP
jgi:3-oxoadipate enol-lactonase